MTEQEVFNEITSNLKWYVGYCTAAYASELKSKFYAGILGEKAKNKLFNHFGYKVKKESVWEKKNT